MGKPKAKNAPTGDDPGWVGDRTLVQDALEHLDPALSVFDGDFKLALFNQRFIELLDFPAELVEIGRPFKDFLRFNAERGEYGPGDIEELVRERLTLAEKREPHSFDRIREDGTVLEVRGNPLPGGGFVTTYPDITERKRAETAIAHQKALFEAVFRDVPDAMVLVNTDREIIMCNPAFTRILGYDFEDVAGRQTAVFYESQEEFERQGRIRFHLSAEESLEPYVVSYKRKNGEVFPGETIGTAIRDEDGNTLGYIGVIRDISERLAAEAALEESESRFRDFAGATSDYFWEMDENLRFSYFSGRFTEVTGVPVELLIGKTRRESGIEADVDPELYQQHLDDLAAHRPFRNFIHPRTLPDGTVVHLSISGAPVFDEDGNFKGYRGTGTDISERTRAEEAQRESEQRYRNLVELAPDSIVVHREGRIVYANPAAASMVGAANPGELIGMSLLELVHPDYRMQLEDRLRALEGEGTSLPLAEYEIKGLDGRSVVIEAVGGQTTFAGEPAALSIIRDITDRRLAEERLIEAIESLQEGFALFDADDRLVLFNEEYLRLHPDTGYMIKPGMLFDDFVRERVRLGMNIEAVDRAEEHIQERLEQHRNPTGPVVRNLTDGSSYVIKKSRTPDGGVVVTETDITAQRRAEQALQESEQRFRDIAGAASDYFWETDADLRFSYVSERFFEVTGMQPEDIRGKTRWEFHSVDATEEPWRTHKEMMVTRQAFRDFEISYTQADGTTLYASISGAPVFDEGGAFKGYRGTSTDITERRQAEEALRQSEEQHRLITDALPATILYLDSEMRYRFANKYAEKWFGCPASEIIGRRSKDILGAEQFEKFRPQVETVLAGEMVTSEAVMTHPDGNTRTVGLTFVPDFGGEGVVQGYFVLALDLTERKQAEEALIQSEGLLNSIIENIPVGLLVKDADHIVERANSTYLNWYGFDSDIMVDRRSDEIEDFQSAEEAKFMNSQEREVLTTGLTQRRQVERPFADGEVHTVSITKFPVYDQQGNIIKVGSSSVDLTEQVEARKALADSEIRFRDFAESASDWLWEMDEHHRFKYVSERYREVTGFDPSIYLGKTRCDITPEDTNSEKWRQHYGDLEDRRPFRDFHYDLTKSDGSLLTVSISGKPVFDADGNFRGFRGTGTDITEQRRAEEAAAKAHDLLIDAIEALSDGFVLYDSDDRMIMCNSKYRELHPIVADIMVPGARFEDILRTAVARGQHPEAIGRVEEWVQERMDLYRNPRDPIEQQLASGGWLRSYERPTEDGGVVGIRTDITTLKGREHALQESEERFKDFADASSDYFWEMDENLRFSYFSERFSDVTGVPVERLIGKTRQESGIESDVDPELYQQHLDDLAAHRPFRDFVHSRERPDGKLVYLSISGVPVFDAAGDFRGYRGTGADITEQRRAEAARDEAFRETERANQAKSEFLATMSHELRTPLNAILGFSDILSNQYFGPPGAEKYQEYARDIHSSGVHLLELVNDLLDVSAIEAGKTALDKEALSIEDMITDCTHTITEMIEAKGIDLETKVPKDLPPLYADSRAIKQVLLNLLSNAVKFTPDGGKITVEANMSEQDTEIVVTDTGTGIPTKRLPNIMKPFIRGERDPYKTDRGWGLGLSISKSLVELHDGEMDIKSQLGKGTTVTVSLPNNGPQPVTATA